MNILQNFSDFVRNSKSFYNVKLTEISASTLDSRAFSARVLQYSSWVEDGLMNVVYQLHAGTGKMSDYLGVKYPRNIEETGLRDRGFPRRTLLFRIRYLLRSLMAFSYEPARFQSWQFAGMEQLLEIFVDQMEQALGEGACLRLVEFVECFKRLWSPVSKDRDSRDALVAELGRLVDLVMEAFNDLQISFIEHECEIQRREERKDEIDEMAENVKAVRSKLENEVAPTMEEIGETMGNIERRQCRRTGISAPVSLTAQDRCEALWNECKAHPEMIGKNAEGRRVRKKDAFDYLMKNHRLPPSVTTCTGFARAVELAQKRHRKKAADGGNGGNRGGNLAADGGNGGNRVGNPAADGGNRGGNLSADGGNRVGNPTAGVGNRGGNLSVDGGNGGNRGGNLAADGGDDVGDLRESILAIIRDDPEISAAKIGARLRVSKRTVERQLNLLKKGKHLYRVGSTRGRWDVSQGLTGDSPQGPGR